jgi:hypothetical protein
MAIVEFMMKAPDNEKDLIQVRDLWTLDFWLPLSSPLDVAYVTREVHI